MERSRYYDTVDFVVAMKVIYSSLFCNPWHAVVTLVTAIGIDMALSPEPSPRSLHLLQLLMADSQCCMSVSITDKY